MVVGFVAGATGFTGKALVAALAQGGHAAVAHVRPDSRDLAHWQEYFGALGAQVDTSPWQAEALAETLKNRRVTHVFCCVGTTRARMKAQGAAQNSYEAVDYGLPKMLAEAAAKAGCVTRYVYLSSLGAGPGAKGAYLQWRWRAEEAVRGAGVAWTVARPSFITGQRDQERTSEAVAAKIADGVLGAIGALGATTVRDRYRSTNDARLARALLRIGLDPAFANQVVLSDELQR
ncbi:MAG: NAD(P)H-binding protein [Deltaproteobacteria bacterium]|nr:NAD(P)H-binding protein [Deltaproteobacteria bacterium]